MDVSVKDGGFPWFPGEFFMQTQLYQLHHHLYQEDIPFWSDITEGCERVLELGCGTGRVTVALGEKGRTVWGLDHDRNQLEFARAELEKRPRTVQDKVHFLAKDMRSFHLGCDFDILLSPCNTYSLFPEEGRISILECVVEHLKPHGLFSFSVPNPHQLLKWTREWEEREGGKNSVLEEIIQHPVTRNPVQISSWVEPAPNGVRWTWHYDHLMPDGQVERQTVSNLHHDTPVDMYLSELRRYGFSIQRFGDFDKSSFTKESPYLIVLGQCSKGKPSS